MLGYTILIKIAGLCETLLAKQKLTNLKEKHICKITLQAFSVQYSTMIQPVSEVRYINKAFAEVMGKK